MIKIPIYRKLKNLICLVIAVPIASGLSEAEAQESELERLIYSYGNLETAAGIGVREEKEVDGTTVLNLWLSEFEGAQATTIELSNPHMTMADRAGNLYIADKESHSILKVDTQGVVTTVAGTHGPGFNGDTGNATAMHLNFPNGLHVLPDGTFYILDLFNRRVRRVDRRGAMTTVLEDATGFGPGRGLWVSPDETTIFYNGTGRVMRWTAETGSMEFASGFADPGNIAVDAEGNLFVTDRGAHVVYRIQPNGSRTIIAGDGSDNEPVDGSPATSIGLEDVRGIALRPDGSFFLCTQKGGDVVFVDSRGIATALIRGTRSGNTHEGDGLPLESPGEKISEPRAVTLAPSGDLIITTNDNGFIRVVRAIPAPEGLTASFGNPGNLTFDWQPTEGIAVDIEHSTSLRKWSLLDDATSLTTGHFEVEQEGSLDAASYFRLRPHRPYPGDE
ncbi:MAG: hypothetical protein KDN22_12615 [Verrucomicrobiae bacterium]|nr:hypothetical protein [Verrucomicrobiae bacterium]